VWPPPFNDLRGWMSYSATVRRLLISCPGDVLQTDLAIVRKVINRWNGMYGHQFAAAVIPISWGSHATAEFGRHPQEILNEQLVDSCDMGLAVFANRLGTQTATAESGTVEEIERLHAAGKHVAVLRSRRPVDTGTINLEQTARLEAYLATIRDRALVLTYSNDVDLENHVEAILVNAISRDQARAELQIEAGDRSAGDAPAASRHAEVWPRVEANEYQEMDSRGRVRMSRNWYLVLSNTGHAPARDVRFDLHKVSDQGEVWSVDRDSNGDDAPDVEVLAPGGDARFTIFAAMGSAVQVRGVVTWTDDRGPQQNVATLRLT
jgi:hypothetical protein